MGIPSSPHARGDVPACSGRTVAHGGFSPRPWGCSVSHAALSMGIHLLPTPVGMFRNLASSTFFLFTSPHARGDVPEPNMKHDTETVFSPRPWGCSEFLGRLRFVDCLLPTPVGMFQFSKAKLRFTLASPHARGDVPFGFVDVAGTKCFSPRPWGCSAQP